MLIQLREGLRNSKILKFVFVGIITVPFALFGVGSYFTAAIDTDAATVNGEEVSVQQFQSALLQQQERMRQMFGGKVPDGLLENPQMREGALEQLIQQQLMVQRVQGQNYTVSDAELAKSIRERQDFQVNGEFDQGRYEQILAANRMSNAVFEESARRDEGLVQLFNAVTGSAFVLPLEAGQAASLKNQEREVLLAEVDVDALSEAAEVTDEEVSVYYGENEAKFMRPEQFKVSYLEINSESLEEAAAIDDLAVEDEYQSRIDEFATPEQRDASHILLSLDEDADQVMVDEVMAKAESLKAQLNDGADFATLAKENSNDPGSAENGGSLGLFAKGAMVAAFEESAFALEVGQISEPVRTPFGVHIIKLNAVQDSVAKPLDDVREELREELVQRQISAVFFEKQDLMATESFENSGSLEPAASALGMEVQQSDWFSSESPVGVGQFPEVRAAVSTDDVLSAGLNSSVLEVAENHAIVLRLDERKDEELKPLEEVREQIVATLKSEKGNEAGQEKADALLAAVESGEEFVGAAQAQSLTAAEPVWSKRDSPEIDRTVLAEVFASPFVEGEVFWGQVVSAAGNPVVFGLKGVRASDEEAGEPSQVVVADAAMVQQQGTAAFQALQAGMRELADVSINEKAINPAAE